MLFILNTSIIDKLCDSPNDELVQAIDNLARARRLGIHLLYAEPNVLEYLKNCELLEKNSRNVFNNLFSRYPATISYITVMKHIIEVVADDNIMESEIKGDKKILRISANIFVDYGILTETILLCENLVDCKIYKLISDVYLFSNKLSKLRIRNFSLLGGGNTTADQYKTIQELRSRLLLCIVDSDKKYPGCSSGDTLKKLQKVNNINELLCEYYSVEVHEIENLIPLKLYKEAAKFDVNINTCLCFLEMIEKAIDFECLMCYDYKNGVKLINLVEGKKSTLYISYWLKIAKSYNFIDQCDIDCTKNSSYVKEQKKKLDKQILTGFGPNILNTLIQNVLFSMSENEIAQMIPEYLIKQWNEIGELIIAWGCGSDRLVAV